MIHKEISSRKYNVYMIHIDKFVDISTYLYMFTTEINKKILSYSKYDDKLMAFTSCLLKYYYLPYILGLDPLEIIIKLNKYGKPYLLNFPEIDFNISHSGKYVILGVICGGKIGVDIEQIDNNIGLDICNTVFNSYEVNQVRTVLDFYVMWVKKEAYLKCLGEGFGTDLYKETRLTTELVQSKFGYDIYASIFHQEYMLAICITT